MISDSEKIIQLTEKVKVIIRDYQSLIRANLSFDELNQFYE